MATHTGIPTWKIPWTEEPGGLQSTTDHTCTCTRTHQLSHGHWKNSPFSDCLEPPLLLPQSPLLSQSTAGLLPVTICYTHVLDSYTNEIRQGVHVLHLLSITQHHDSEIHPICCIYQ